MKSWVLIVCFALMGPVCSVSGAEEMPDALGRSYSSDRKDQSIERAIAYLRSNQHNDGSIHDNGKNKTAMTALAIMAMSAVGHQVTDDTPEGRTMSKALDYVLDSRRMNREGYFGIDGSRTYGHGIVTLMLAEMLGMCTAEQDKLVFSRLRKAVNLILKAQKKEKTKYKREHGGWRYKPNPSLNAYSDISVTIWQVMALRAARNAGFEVPASSIKDAIGYIKRTYRRRYGAFRYSTVAGDPTFNTASMGIMALYLLGEPEASEVKQSLKWLKGKRITLEERFCFYGLYYHSQAMYQVGGERAAEAREWIEKALIAKQQKDGSWEAPKEMNHPQEYKAGRVYCTAMATLTLAVHHHFLPIYQR